MERADKLLLFTLAMNTAIAIGGAYFGEYRTPLWIVGFNIGAIIGRAWAWALNNRDRQEA